MKVKPFSNDKVFRRVKVETIWGQQLNACVNGRNCPLNGVENIVGKGENAGFQHFLRFPQCFQKASSQRLYKAGVIWSRVAPVSAYFKLKEEFKTVHEQKTVPRC